MLTHKVLASAVLVVLILLTVLPTASSRAAEPVSVLLKGHDEEITGFLRRISEARYLLQGGNVYHEFPENQIVTVDGQEAIPESARSGGRLIYTSLREKILPGEIGKALQILADGGDVDYVGAASVELIEPGESGGSYREVEIEGGEIKVVGYR